MFGNILIEQEYQSHQIFRLIMDNLILISGSYDHTLISWDPNAQQPLKELSYGEKVIINRIETSLDKRYLAAAGNFFAAHYDVNQLKSPLQAIHMYDGYKNNITSVGFMKESSFYYTCSEDGYLRMHDTRQATLAREFATKEQLNAVVLHPNENELIFGDQQGSVRVYDYAQNEVRLKLTPAPDIGIRSLTIAQNASQLVAADSSGVCHHYHTHNMDLNADTHYQKFEAHQDYILKVQLSADQKYLATCSADKIVKLWTLNEKGPIPKWEFDKSLFGHSKWIWDCAFSCDSEYLITCSSDQTIRIWQTENGDVLRFLRGHKQAVNCLTFNDIAIDGQK